MKIYGLLPRTENLKSSHYLAICPLCFSVTNMGIIYVFYELVAGSSRNSYYIFFSNVVHQENLVIWSLFYHVYPMIFCCHFSMVTHCFGSYFVFFVCCFFSLHYIPFIYNYTLASLFHLDFCWDEAVITMSFRNIEGEKLLLNTCSSYFLSVESS